MGSRLNATISGNAQRTCVSTHMYGARTNTEPPTIEGMTWRVSRSQTRNAKNAPSVIETRLTIFHAVYGLPPSQRHKDPAAV